MGKRLEVGVQRIVPKTIAAGIDFTAQIGAAARGASLRLILRGPKSIDIDAPAGTRYLIVEGAATAAWPPGDYAYELRGITEVSVRVIERGSVRVLPDVAQLPEGHDGRSANRQALDAIEAVLAKRASLDQQRYRINNRELYRTDIADLLRLRAFYVEQVKREEGRGGSRFKAYRVNFGVRR